MPTVEYNQEKIFEKVEKKKVEHPGLGKTVEVDKRISQNPFELRIAKWLKDDNEYNLYCYVEVTEFGKRLSERDAPKKFVKNNLEVKKNFDYELLDETVKCVEAVKNNSLEKILEFAGIDYKEFEILDKAKYEKEFKLVLDGQTSFDIDWLEVDFEPAKGGV